ncbi:MAG: hypothetical protein K6E87_03945 [bacterium]|nr:hypothetical protein [bacterium]
MTLEMMEIEYTRARELSQKEDIKSLEEAINIFTNLEDFKDSNKFKNNAITKLNLLKEELEEKKKEDYNRAVMLMQNKKSAQRLDQAIKLFNELADYKDSNKLKEECIILRQKVMKGDKKSLDRLKLVGYLFAGIGIIAIAFIICAVIWNIVSNGGN